MSELKAETNAEWHSLQERVKSAARIEDVADDFLTLKQVQGGRRYMALCPFHDDRHFGSFYLFPSSNTFKCFSCGAFGDPINFVQHIDGEKSYVEAVHWLARRYGIEAGGVAVSHKPKPKPMPLLDLGMAMPHSFTNTEGNALIAWLRGLAWSDERRQRLELALTEYFVGTSLRGATKGWTIFWYLDDLGQCLDGKLMKYASDGHRAKGERYTVDFVASKLLRVHALGLSGKAVGRCLFGLHLADRYPDATVVIVESEKTAVIAQAYDGGQSRLYMATGGMGSLTKEKLAPLFARRRYVKLYPDADGYEAWRHFAHTCDYPRISVSEDLTALRQAGSKADLADIVIGRLGDE